MKITIQRKSLHEATSGAEFYDLVFMIVLFFFFFFLKPGHIGWVFTEMASETSSVLSWIWGIHLCRTSQFLLDFMNCLNLYVI